jgi:DNA-binding SARP family transcriptional activator
MNTLSCVHRLIMVHWGQPRAFIEGPHRQFGIWDGRCGFWRNGGTVSRLEIVLLGSYRVTLDDLPVTTFPTDKVRALLAYLVVESERPHRREVLASLLWPDSPEIAARTSLRQALYRLRCALGNREASVPHLLPTAKEVRLNPASDHWLDVTAFEALISACRARHPRGLNLCPDCVARLEAAVELYQGDFLAGFSLPDCPRFDWWQLSTREACHRRAMEALTWLTIHHESRGEHAQLLKYARRAIELEPWRESAYRGLMRALALTGRRGEALHQYEICRDELAQEMGVEPSAETVQLYERIRSRALSGFTPCEAASVLSTE